MARKGEYPLKLNICEGFSAITSNKEKLYCFRGSKEDDSATKIEIKTSPGIICINE